MRKGRFSLALSLGDRLKHTARSNDLRRVKRFGLARLQNDTVQVIIDRDNMVLFSIHRLPNVSLDSSDNRDDV
jgi:hypothetical protein